MSGAGGQEPGGEERAPQAPGGLEVAEVTTVETVLVLEAEPRRRRRPGRWWRWPLSALVLFVEGLLLIAIFGGSMLAWRAAQGPVDLSWLLPRLGRIVAVAAPQYSISVSHLAFNWRGFTHGPDQPVRIAADGIAVDNHARHERLTLDHLALDLSAAWAVRGVFAPRVVSLDGLHVTLRRAPAAPPKRAVPEGDARPPRHDPRATARDVIAVLRQPPETDKHLTRVHFAGLSELQRVTITGGSIVLEPPPSPAGAPPPQAPDLAHRVMQLGDITLTAARIDAGGLSVQLSAVLASRAGALPAATAGERPSLSLRGLVTQAGEVTVSAAAELQDPAGMVSALGLPASLPVPAMAVQAGFSLTASPAARITALQARMSAGAGDLRINGAHIPVSSLAVSLAGDEDAVRIDPASRIVLGAVSQAPPPTISISGDAQRQGDGISATLGLGLDHVASDDVPAYWPPGFADGARSWIKAQVHGGTLDHGTFAFGFRSTRGLGDLSLVSVAGGIPADGLTVAWLPPLPPLTQVKGAILLHGMDAVAIKVDQATEGALTLGPSSMVISGLLAKTQVGAIDVNLSGPVAAAMALLNQPRLNLLRSAPVPLKVTGGTLKTAVRISLPLDADVTTDQLKMTTHAELSGLGLSGLLLGRNVTGGQLAIDATMDGLHLAGTCQLAGIPVQLVLDTVFAVKTPDQAVATLTAKATASPAQLAAAGIPTAGLVRGPVAAAVDVSATEAGRTDITARLSLPAAQLRIAPIGWAGGAGTADATAHLILQKGAITGFDPVTLQGPGIDVAVRPSFAAGRLAALDFIRVKLGQTDLSGRLGLPAAAGAPYVVSVQGRTLDLSGLFGPKPKPSVKPTNQALSQISSREEFTPHPPWRASVSLGRILFGAPKGGPARELTGVRGQAVNNGRIVQSANVSLTVAPSGAPTHLTIVQNGRGGRQVTLTSGDLGGLLKATNTYDLINGGALRIDATYNDQLPSHPLTGKAEMDKFTLGNAPTIGKVLQAMTLYGMVDLLHGSGLFFTRMVAPFTLESRRLTLTEARAYSASLGLTAHGTVNLPENSFDIHGTVVPAYFFNSLLGHIPIIGKLFSPEKGGGLFAADFELVGPINDPAVHVNPLSIIAPGALRGLFQSKNPHIKAASGAK